MTDLLRDIADTADELTNPQRHVERINPDHNPTHRREWTVTLPSLLDQLASAVIPGEAYAEDEAGARGEFESKPAARLDAVDRLLAIEAGAAVWCRRAGLRLREHPAANIRGLVGAAPVLVSDDQAQLLADLRAWRTWAATVTGWERPPDAPRAPCPACDRRGGLRVRLARSTACCVACGAAWDVATIGVLADHIRRYATAANDTKGLRRAAVLARRAEEAARVALAGPRRPDLPYVDWR